MPKYDLNVLYLRAENARSKLKEIAQNLHKSSPRLKYNLAIMEKEGLLRDPYCVFDYSYFGLLLFRVYFKGGYISEQDKNTIITKLRENPYITTIYEFTSEFDLTIEFSTPNPSKFNKELKKIATEIPTLNNYKISLNLVSHIYPRHYLLKNPLLQQLYVERIVGGDREREQFSSEELNVIKHLLLNPTERLTSLARKTDLNIIKGFKYHIDTNALGVYHFRLFLKIHNTTVEREAQLMEFLTQTKEIVQMNKIVGDWDMEIDIQTFDKTKTRAILLQLREQFKELIERFNVIEFYSYYKRSFLPLFLFKEEK